MLKLETLHELRTGKIDLHMYLNDLYDLIEAKEKEIQALVPGTFDQQKISQQADELYKTYSPDPEFRPLLYGVPVGVKDIFRVDGFPTQCGSALPPSLFDGPEAACVTRLRKAGAIILAKTVTTEFAYFEPGPTRNPNHLEHTPGGSSSGSAAGVAAGYFPLALGSQTVGSIIRPAAYCGVVGFKPSAGRVSKEGVIPFSPTADQIGIFCKDVEGVECSMLVLDETWSWKKRPERVSLGIPVGPYLDQVTDEVKIHFEQQVDLLESKGYKIKKIPMFENFEFIHDTHHLMTAAEKARVHAPWFDHYQELYRPRTRAWIERGQSIDDATLNLYQQQGLLLRNEIENIMGETEIDVWICPSTLDTAPKGLDSTGNPAMNLPWTSAGLPAISLPSGKNKHGLPFGIQVVAGFHQDEILLIISKKFEQIFSSSFDFP